MVERALAGWIWGEGLVEGNGCWWEGESGGRGFAHIFGNRGSRGGLWDASSGASSGRLAAVVGPWLGWLLAVLGVMLGDRATYANCQIRRLMRLNPCFGFGASRPVEPRMWRELGRSLHNSWISTSRSIINISGLVHSNMHSSM